MKKNILGLALLIACPALSAKSSRSPAVVEQAKPAVVEQAKPAVVEQAKQEATWKTLAKATVAAGATVGFGLIAYKHVMVDLSKPKGYLSHFSLTQDYFKQNGQKMSIDFLKLVGFAYLTYVSGSYTLARVNELTKLRGH